MTTPAGIFYLTQGNNYHGFPAFIRRTKSQVESGNINGTPSSIHYGDITSNEISNGCTRMRGNDLQELQKYISKDTPCYVLPANPENKFAIRNGTLIFKSPNSKVNSYNPIVSKPIKGIVAKNQKLPAGSDRHAVENFTNALVQNKQQLQNDLGINNDTYNSLVLSALGIMGAETSFGQTNTLIYTDVAKAISKKVFGTGGPDYKAEYKWFRQNDDNNSIGLTQIRISQLSDEEKQLFDKYNITKEDLVYDPRKAAIATMIKLAYAYKNMGGVKNAIKSWNTKPSYYNTVEKFSNMFDIIEEFKHGGKCRLIKKKRNG